MILTTSPPNEVGSAFDTNSPASSFPTRSRSPTASAVRRRLRGDGDKDG